MRTNCSQKATQKTSTASQVSYEVFVAGAVNEGRKLVDRNHANEAPWCHDILCKKRKKEKRKKDPDIVPVINYNAGYKSPMQRAKLFQVVEVVTQSLVLSGPNGHLTRGIFTDAAHVLILLEWCVGECRGVRLVGVLRRSRSISPVARPSPSAVVPQQLLCVPKLCILCQSEVVRDSDQLNWRSECCLPCPHQNQAVAAEVSL